MNECGRLCKKGRWLNVGKEKSFCDVVMTKGHPCILRVGASLLGELRACSVKVSTLKGFLIFIDEGINSDIHS